MSKRPLQVSPFLAAAQSTSSEVFDFHIWFSPDFLMQSRQARQDSIRCIARPNFIIGFDFAVTLPSPESVCVLFDITSELPIGRTDMANAEQTQKMIPFITCEISLGQYVCELVLGVNVFDLDLGVQIDSIEQPISVSLSGFFPL